MYMTQSEQIKLDVEFEREKEALEAKYHNQKTPLFEKVALRKCRSCCTRSIIGSFLVNANARHAVVAKA